MTTDAVREPGEGAEAVDAVRDGRGLRPEDGQTTTVPVIPLWARHRTGVRG